MIKLQQVYKKNNINFSGFWSFRRNVLTRVRN
jgi:hypothetical protein